MLRSVPRALLLATIALGATAPLAAASAKGPAPTAAGQTRIVVAYDDGTSTARRTTSRATVDAHLLRRAPTLGVDVLTVPSGDADDALRVLNARPDVRYAERDLILHANRVPNDPGFGSLWNMARIGAPQVWDQIVDASSITVGVVDSGVSLIHEDLAAQLWKNPGESGAGREANGMDDDNNGFVDDVDGWDFYYGVNDPSPNVPHGTHVAGTIGAAGDNGRFVAGVAWRAKILPVAVLGPDGSGYGSDIAAGFDYAASNGARIVNASLGGAGRSTVLQNALARHPTTLFVVSAGNDDANNDVLPVTPCDEPVANVLCVAATDQTDDLASFSNYGLANVDLAAPGTDIVSLVPGNSTATLSGTSMAAPLVTGVATLALAAHPWLTTTQLKAAVMDGATRLPALSGRVATGARLDAPGALAAARDSIAPSVPTVVTPTGGWRSLALEARWTASSDAQSGLAGYDVTVDGRLIGSTAANVTALSLPPLPDGQHSVVVAARDSEGNRGASPALAFSTDATAPVPPAPHAPAANASLRRATLAFAFAPATDAASGVRGSGVLLDGAAIAIDAFGRPNATAQITEGLHQWSTNAVDNAGNIAVSPAVPFTIDDSAPRVVIGSARRLRVVPGGVAVTLKAGEVARATVTLAAARSAARKLGVRVRNGLARLGTMTTPLGASATTVKLRVKRSTLARLRHAHHLKLRVTVAAVDAAGNRQTVILSGRT